jgi:hypothetical protein
MTEIMNFQLIVAYRRVEETDIEQVLLDLLTKALERVRFRMEALREVHSPPLPEFK